MLSRTKSQIAVHQSPKEVILIRPGFFAFDVDTKDSNAFQNDLHPGDEKKVHEDALEEVSNIKQQTYVNTCCEITGRVFFNLKPNFFE